MRRKWNKGLVTLAMVSMMLCVSACGNKPSADTFDTETETEESTIETTENGEETAESSESEETAPLQTASGHQHNVDVEEKMKETDAEEEVQEEEREEEVQTESTTAEKEETEVPTTAPEATTAPTAESTTAPTPSTPDMSQLEEWMPPVNMLVVCDANVVDENGNVLGPIEKGSDIGVTGQCPGFYQVNYGAKRSFLPKDCLSSR